jgi:penicillin-binding protein 1A
MRNVYQAYDIVRNNIEQVVSSDLPQGSQVTMIYARDYDPQTGNGTLLATEYKENRQQADYEEIPAMLIVCVLSTEDHRYFEHHGVDVLGTMRAIARGVLRGSEMRGTSTITMQLSRNVYLPTIRSQRTMNRKIQEYIIAGALEQRFTKEQLLEAYLNHTFLGANSYGVKTAAKRYFDKDLDELTLAECALLAGIPQAPTRYNPYLNPESAKARRDSVLRLLKSRVGTDFFSELAQYDPDKFGSLKIATRDVDAALDEPISLSSSASSKYKRAGYFSEYVLSHVLPERYDKSQLEREGLAVVTTLDPLYQDWAEEIIKEKVDKYRENKRVSQAALILLEAATGEVLACVGGYEWGSPNSEGQPDHYNRAMMKGRPVGSAFKPFTYSTAYEQGFPVTLTVWDGPNKELSEKVGTEWPQNSDKTYLGWISIFYALQMSRNAATVDLIYNVTGIEPVIETARRMGISARLDPVPAITLGVADIRPVEMAEAFDTFPNMGQHVKHIVVKRVYNQDGVMLESNDSSFAIERRSNQAFSENTAWMMVQNMYRVVEAGTGTRARVPGVQIAGKTGTNDDFADAWFVGYSPELICAIWVGNDDYALQMRRMFGGDMPAEVFAALMKRIYTEQTETIIEGEDDQEPIERVIYEPRYQVLKFQKPENATFSGFPAPQVGSVMARDEEGNLVMPEDEAAEEEDDSGDDGSSEDENSDFYRQWEPPPYVHF